MLFRSNELRAQVEAERVAWPAERQRRFDGHVDDFQLMRLRQQAALRAHGLDASSVSAMHAAWRGEIDYLEEAVLPAAAGDVHP